jgi:hypothetical protein
MTKYIIEIENENALLEQLNVLPPKTNTTGQQSGKIKVF